MKQHNEVGNHYLTVFVLYLSAIKLFEAKDKTNCSCKISDGVSSLIFAFK